LLEQLRIPKGCPTPRTTLAGLPAQDGRDCDTKLAGDLPERKAGPEPQAPRFSALRQFPHVRESQKGLHGTKVGVPLMLCQEFQERGRSYWGSPISLTKLRDPVDIDKPFPKRYVRDMKETRRDEEGRVACVRRQGFRLHGRRVEIRFAEVEGRLVCVGLEIGPHKLSESESFVDVVDDDLRPLQSAEIRLPLRELVDRALEMGGLVFQVLPGEDIYDLGKEMHSLWTAALAEKKTGRPRLYERDHFERVARIYLEHQQSGGRAPTKAVAEQMASGSKSTAAKWVARAREMELLPPYEEER
jgi:hypothetical protein